jgi:hypothetical protein
MTTTVGRRLRFRRSHGWTVVPVDLNLPGIDAIWATNVPVAGDDLVTTWPTVTGQTLPSDGAIVYASIADDVVNPEEFPSTLERPFSLTGAHFLREEYEGRPAPNVSLARLNGRVGDAYLLVHVYFGSPDPSPPLVALVGRQLAALDAA